MKTFDVICPVFNEDKTVPLFYARIEKMFDTLKSNYMCRLIFVDNCSTDATQSTIRNIIQKNQNVSLITMSRNFGYQCSVECGLRNSDADLTAVVDVDCEDPPELFIEFLKHIESGYDIVYGERVDRHENAFIKFMRKIFYRVTRAVADDHIYLDMAEFCIISRAVKENILLDNNSYPFIRASIGRVGFSAKNIPYKRAMRIAGETHYNFWRMALFAIAGVLSSSTLWLRIPVYVFPFWSLLILIFVLEDLRNGSLDMTHMTLATGLIFIGFTVTGISLYLARTYRNGLNRPNYFINSKKSIMPTRAT